MPDFPNDNQIQRSFERAGHFNTKYNATTRKAINNNGLAFVSDESFSESFAGIYAIYKHVAPRNHAVRAACWPVRFSAKLTTVGFSSFTKPAYVIRIVSTCVPALNSISACFANALSQ